MTINPNQELPRQEESPLDRLDVARTVGSLLRGIGQAIGLLLVVVGAYFAIQTASDALSFIRDPANMTTRLEGMSKTLQIKQTEIVVGNNKISLGRTLAGGQLAVWFLVCTWVSLKLVTVGGGLALAVERPR